MPSTSCSVTRRSKTRFLVCRCLRGASRSARNIASMAGLNGSSRDLRGGSFFRGCGNADDGLAAATSDHRWRRARCPPRCPSPPVRRVLCSSRFTGRLTGRPCPRAISGVSAAGTGSPVTSSAVRQARRGRVRGRALAPRRGATAPACRTARSAPAARRRMPALRRRSHRTRCGRPPAAPTGWRAARHPAPPGARPAARRKHRRSRPPTDTRAARNTSATRTYM